MSIRDKLTAGVNDTGGHYNTLPDHEPVIIRPLASRQFVKLPLEQQDLQYLARDILFVLENVSAPRY